MIRTYSDEAIVLAKAQPIEGKNGVSIVCEFQMAGAPREAEIRFYGERAERARRDLIPGMRFVYRGYVDVRKDGTIELVGVTYTPIA